VSELGLRAAARSNAAVAHATSGDAGLASSLGPALDPETAATRAWLPARFPGTGPQGLCCNAPRAAARGNAAVARAHPAESRSRPAFSYRNLFQPSVAMAKKKAAAAKPAAKK